MEDLYPFMKMLRITYNDMRSITHDFGEIYMNEEASDEIKQVLLADAFNKMKDWFIYYKKFKNIKTTEFNRIKEEKETIQKTYAEKINDMSKLVENIIAENTELKEENKKLKEKFSNENNAVSTLIEKITTLEETVTTDSRESRELRELLVTSNSNSKVHSDVANALNRALDMIEENAKALSLSRKLKTEPRVNMHGKEHPRYNNNIDNNSLIADYKSGMILKDLSNKYGMSIPGIRNRLMDLGVYNRVYNKDK